MRLLLWSLQVVVESSLIPRLCWKLPLWRGVGFLLWLLIILLAVLNFVPSSIRVATVLEYIIRWLRLFSLNCSHLSLYEVILGSRRSDRLDVALSQGDGLLSHCKGGLCEATSLLGEAAKIRFRTDFQVSDTAEWFTSTKAAVMLHEKVKSEIELITTVNKRLSRVTDKVVAMGKHLLFHLVALLLEI